MAAQRIHYALFIVLIHSAIVFNVSADLQADVQAIKVTLENLVAKLRQQLLEMTTKQNVLEYKVQHQEFIIQHLSSEKASLKAKQSLLQAQLDNMASHVRRLNGDTREQGEKLAQLEERLGQGGACQIQDCSKLVTLDHPVFVNIQDEVNNLTLCSSDERQKLDVIKRLSDFNTEAIKNQTSVSMSLASNISLISGTLENHRQLQQHQAQRQEQLGSKLANVTVTLREMDNKLTNCTTEQDSIMHNIAKLEISQPNIIQYTWKSHDVKNEGVIKMVTYNKRHASSSLRVSYYSNVYVGTYACARWWVEFNGTECYNPMPIDANINNGETVYYVPVAVSGVCNAIAAGQVTIAIKVGACYNYRPGDAETGFGSTSRIIVEEFDNFV